LYHRNGKQKSPGSIDPSVNDTANPLSRKRNHPTSRLAQEKGILYLKSRRSDVRNITLLRRKNDDNDDSFLVAEPSSFPSLSEKSAHQIDAEREKTDTKIY